MIKDKLSFIANVKLLGVCENTAAVMSVFDCFILPSYREGFSLSLCEAQAKNIRCVASDVVPDEVVINDNCFVLGIGEPNAKWADYVLGTFTESRNRALDSVDINNSVKKHLCVYKGAVEKGDKIGV